MGSSNVKKCRIYRSGMIVNPHANLLLFDNFLHNPIWLSTSHDKVVELDFLYPSEGIHRRWESGYRITSMAATPDQAAFVLSIPKRKTMDETQETLRTSAFPSTHVKVSASSVFNIYCSWLVCNVKYLLICPRITVHLIGDLGVSSLSKEFYPLLT